MTETQACRRVALAALAFGMLTAAPAAQARIASNGIASNRIVTNGVASNTPAAVARAADPSRLRLRAVRPAGE